MLPKATQSDMITLSEDNAIVTSTCVAGASLTAANTVFTRGTHFWETELLSALSTERHLCWSLQAQLGPRWNVQPPSTDGWFISAEHGVLFGNGYDINHEMELWDRHDEPESAYKARYKKGDRIGMFLDLNEHSQSLTFYKNGEQHGPSYSFDVTGPVVPAVQIGCSNRSIRIIPRAKAPRYAGLGVRLHRGIGHDYTE
jgi:hypothetical protein